MDRNNEPLIGHSIEEHELIGSTNDRALELSASGAPEGLVVTAREQCAGRGRIGRGWVSGRDRGIYLSVLLRPKMPAASLGFLSLAAGLAILRTLESGYGLSGKIKWPNDVLIRGKKIAGVLIESRTGKSGVEALVIGIGLNTNWEAADCEGDFRVPPTAVNLECGSVPERQPLLRLLLEELDRLYRELRLTGGEGLVNGVQSQLDLMGRAVRLLLPTGSVSGILEGIDRAGGLILSLPGGEQKIYYSGELDYADRD